MACHILTSHGIVPNNDAMFELLKSKHPYAIPPTIPIVTTTIPAIELPPTFHISAILLTCPKGTACGPSGLIVQYLLDALDSRLPISMESLLHQVVNILLAANAPTVTKARLQTISAPQVPAWIKVQPSPKLGLELMPDEAQVTLKWWLDHLLTPDGTPCPLCHHNMDAWGHHMLTYRFGVML